MDARDVEARFSTFFDAGARALEERDAHRMVNGIPFEALKLDPRALTMAADLYSEQTGDCDELALGQAVLLYMEAEST